MEKRDGHYYFAAPAGGVSTGWQSVFRSKNIYGPYEDKIVLHQGSTLVNGPHQGGLVQTQSGEWWFLHFQDKDAYGRIVHLQPVTWKDGWPVMGEDKDGDGTGEPVMVHKKPNVGKAYPIVSPQTSDDFNSAKLSLQWQWQAAPNASWYSFPANKGSIRLNAVSNPTDSGSLFYTPNLLLQKFTAPAFTAITKFTFSPDLEGDRAGLTVAGNAFTFLCLEKGASGNSLMLYEGKRENRKFLNPKKLLELPLNTNTIWMRVQLNSEALYKYSYSLNGTEFTELGDLYKAEKGTWIGAKVGIVCLSPTLLPSNGYADFDFFDVKE